MGWRTGVLSILLCALWATPALAAPSPVVFDSKPPAQTNETSATFRFHSTDGAAAFECALDGGGPAACTSPYTVSGLAEGEHTVSVQELTAGATQPATDTWTVDLTPPTTDVTSKPPPLTNSRTATFTFDSPDPTATFRCSLNGAAPQPCTSPVVYSGLSDATRTLLIQAVDPAGNVDTQAQPITWTVDGTPPDTVLANPGNVVGADVVSFSFTSSEPGSTFQCSFDNAAFTPCASPTEVDVPGSGRREFAVRAVDGAGNTDPTPATYNWTSDLTPPKRPKVTIFAAPTAHGSGAVPVLQPVHNGGLGLTFTNPLAKLLSTPPFTLATRLHAQWKSDSTAVSYDVTVETLPDDSTGMDEHGDNVLQIKQYTRTVRSALTLKLYFGTQACVKVDARDKVGNVSKSRTTCTSIPDSFAPPWGPYGFHRVRDSRAWRGYYIVLKRKTLLSQEIGDQFFFAPAHAVLVAERCRGCGSVEFAFTRFPPGQRPLHELAVVNLSGPGRRGRQTVVNLKLPLRRLERDGEGYIVVVRLSGKPRLSGIGFST